MASDEYQLADFLNGKSEHTLALYNYFIAQFKTIGPVDVVPLKTMIGLDNGHRRIAYITQLGKNFVHIIFPFKQGYFDNLCFTRVPQVPGQQQFNHHFRMFMTEDVNEEVFEFMLLAYSGEEA